MEVFAKRLKELRIEKGLTQIQLAKAINVSQSAINKWELAQRKITIDYILELCKFFGVSADYLIGLEEFK